jgi:hypothetical protein
MENYLRKLLTASQNATDEAGKIEGGALNNHIAE